MIEMNPLQIAKGEPVSACRPLVAGTEVQLVGTAEATRYVICGRRRDEQDCSWTFKLGVVPVAIYDREQADTKGLDQFGASSPTCQTLLTSKPSVVTMRLTTKRRAPRSSNAR